MDKRDLQILDVLSRNCRASCAQLAQTLNLSKESVGRRIHEMEKKGIIQDYMLFLDARKLGFTRYHILAQFSENQDTNEAIEKIRSHPFLMWVNTFIGRFDIQVIVDAKNGFHLEKILRELFSDIEVEEYTVLTHLYDLEFTQQLPPLHLNTKIQQKNDHTFTKSLFSRSFPVKKDFNNTTLSAKDGFLLKELSKNPKISLTNLAKKTHITRQTVKTRIQHMIDERVILQFTAVPHVHYFGFVTYYLLVRLKQDAPEEDLRRPFFELSNIFYAGRMMGDYDMILYLNARTPKELRESISKFKNLLGKHLQYFDLHVQEEVHHWKQYTKGISNSI